MPKYICVVFCLLIFLMFSCPSATPAGTLEIPPLKAGQRVYTIPSYFDPPYIGRDGILEINEATKKLHFPFYVILVERLPGFGSEGERAAQAIDGLAQDWARRYYDFDVAKSQLFLLSYEPRQYRFLAGAKFKAELGFERDAHRPYTQIFDRYVRGTPKDPKGGIIAMMASVDEYLFNQTDPVAMTARAEVERNTLEAKRLSGTINSLNAQILRLSDLLEQKKYLPADISDYQKILTAAISAKSEGDRPSMVEIMAPMQKHTDTLDKYVSGKKHDARAAIMKSVVKYLLWFFSVAFVILTCAQRGLKLKSLRSEFITKYGKWMEKVSNASAQYNKMYGERQGVLDLVGNEKNANALEGQTKTLYINTTAMIDEICITVCAMSEHIEQMKQMTSRASFFRLGPLVAAISGLEQKFMFDTGKINDNDLFGRETKQTEIDPAKFAEDLQLHFEIALESWDQLKMAAEIRNKPASELFTEKKLDGLLAKADENGIPRRWLGDHPLFGDFSSDQKFYEGLDAIRKTDPVKYFEEIDSAKWTENGIAAGMNALLEALNLAKKNRMESAPLKLDGICLDPDDDPAFTFEQARREEANLAECLTRSKNTDEVSKIAQCIDDLYKKCSRQVVARDCAKETVENLLKTADTLKKGAESAINKASARYSMAEKIHKEINTGNLLSQSTGQLQEGITRIEKAGAEIQETRYISAIRETSKAIDRFKGTIESCANVINDCDALDRKKAEYEKRVAELADKKAQYARKIQGYGLDARLSDFVTPGISGAVNYAVLLSLLDSTEHSWQDAERQARSNYQEAMRKQEERERMEKQRRNEERRREEERRSEISFSSGNSWGSSSSSPSGSSSSGGGW